MEKSTEEQIAELQAYVDMLHSVLDHRFSDMVTNILNKEFDDMINDALSDAYGDIKTDVDNVGRDLYNLDNRVDTVESVLDVTVSDHEHNINAILNDIDNIQRTVKELSSSVDELYGLVENGPK